MEVDLRRLDRSTAILMNRSERKEFLGSNLSDSNSYQTLELWLENTKKRFVSGVLIITPY